MVVFGESETSEILANCHPRDLRSHVIILRLTHQSGAAFRMLCYLWLLGKVLSINCESYIILVVLLSKVPKSAPDFWEPISRRVRPNRAKRGEASFESGIEKWTIKRELFKWSRETKEENPVWPIGLPTDIDFLQRCPDSCRRGTDLRGTPFVWNSFSVLIGCAVR
jgi:hypothetical protein